ncbi:MAG: hypothetical protein AAB776_00825 [Patescibacteria group bacterium]
MRVFLCVMFFAACHHHTTRPGEVYLDRGSESSYGQCDGNYDLDLSGEQIDFNERFIDADYDNAMRGRLIIKGDDGHFVGCLVNRGHCPPPGVVYTYQSESGLQVCLETQHCCNLGLVKK